MKPITFLAIVFLFAGCEKSDFLAENRDTPLNFTEIGGVVSGSLEFRNSPFHIINSLIIDSGDQLKIESGVILLFADSTMMIVKGKLKCIGTQFRFIQFRALDNHWLGIKFLDADSGSVMRFSTVKNVVINTADYLQQCTIEVIRSQLTLQNCIIRDNRSPLGGGLYSQQSRAVITNNIFRNNQAATFGGALLCDRSHSQINNNTIYSNISFNYGGGLVIKDPLFADIQNNILYKNLGKFGDPRIAFFSGDSANFREQYNFLSLGDLDPKFLSDDDLHLRLGSPCRNNGNPAPAFNDPDDSRNDQGAYGGPLGDW